MVDARLKDGSRVNAIILPLAIDGPTPPIRRFADELSPRKDLVRLGALDESAGKGAAGSGPRTPHTWSSRVAPAPERRRC